MMSNLKSELPISDHDDHSQPINLAAPRAPAPPISFTNPGSTSTSTQPVTLRGHTESQKPGLMLQTLYIRAPSTSPRPPGPSHVMTPIMGSQVTATQHFNTKPVFKSVKGVKVNYYSDNKGDKTGVIRMPSSDNNTLHNNSTQSASLVSNILPNALAGNPTRHMVSSALHPVISGGVSNSGSMASIIKGSHQVSQVGHVIHPPYSSHVPRGPAAVASITSAPKSAVATPILRAPHSSSAMTLASSVIAPHAAASFRTRSPTLVTGRTATPPVVSSISHQQVIDLQKNAVSHSLQTQSQACLVSRSIDMSTSSMRPGISHPSIGPHNKPMNSQPIVQHLQQVGKHVSEKSYLKTVSSASNAQSNSIPAHQNTSHLTNLTSNHSTSSDVHGIVPTIARATLSNISSSSGYPTGIVQPSTGSAPTLRPSLVQPHPLHALSSAPSTPHQTLTVISAKSLQSTSSPVTVSSQLNRTITVCSTGIASSGTIVTTSSALPSTHSRLLGVPSSVNQSVAIPVAKVYPQSLPVQLKADHIDLDHNRPTTLVTAGSVASITTTNTTSQNVVVTEKRTDSTASVRMTSLGKHITSNTTYSSGPPATYLYDQYHGTTLAVHPYSMPSSNQNFSTGSLPGGQLRPLALSQHGNANMGSGLHPSVSTSSNSTGSVQPLNSLMVAVDSRHITLHSPYNASNTSKSNTETSHQTTTMMTNSSAGLVVTSQASSGQNSSSGPQGSSTSNHLSPRPSILRKRTMEGISGITKRNLIPNLCATQPLSPRPEFKPSINLLSSLKRTNESLQENGITTLACEPEGGRLLVTSPIKKELGMDNKKAFFKLAKNSLKVETGLFASSEAFNKECPIETSPRKKPRKQLLSANELMETHSSDTEENFSHEPHLSEIKTEENENVKWVTFSKRPSMSLLKNYKHNWKSRHNHFVKYMDVKLKEEKRPSVHELANQKCVLHDIKAWKIHHLTGQMEILNNAEETSISRMSHWLDLEEKGSWISSNSLSNEDYKILTKLTDIVKGNLQRSKIAQEQAMESKQQVLKIVDHKPNLAEIVNKYISRRPLKKKEKT